MNERPCLRCQHPLSLENGQLMYCNACGAPQIFLSEALQEQAAAELQSYRERTALDAGNAETEADAEAFNTTETGVRRDSKPSSPRLALGPWPVAVGTALLAGAIALGLDLLALLFAPVALLAWLWAVSAPILAVGFYSNRTRSGRFTAGFAARLGLLTGLLVALGCALAFTLHLALSRFAFHDGTANREIATTMAQLRSSVEAQSGAAAAAPVLHMLGIPEFRVGFLLWVGAVTAGLYLCIAAATAGVAGLLLGRRPLA